MLCGLETYHESGRLQPGASAAALVCSVDKNATRWTSTCVLTGAGQIIHDKLQELFAPCLADWLEVSMTFGGRERFRTLSDLMVARSYFR